MTRCLSCFEEYDSGLEVCPHCGYKKGSPPVEVSHLFPGTELAGRYIIGRAVGFGGFGITYKALDTKLDVIVAVKEYYPSGIVNRAPGTKDVIVYARKRQREYDYGRDRFLDEARNMAKFSSEPNIINVFEYFEENNTAYIVMEFLNGISLSSYIHTNGGKIDSDQGMDIARSIGSALSVIHGKGIVHRDVSPDNIFLCFGGGIKLIDFGAARFSQDESRLMTIILKPGFAPPEQYEKINAQGPWTDVYALGATLYYVLTGVKPAESTNRRIKDELAYPHTIEPSIPLNLSNCIMKAMAIDLRLRFRSVDEFLRALDSGKPIVTVEKEKRRKNTKRAAGIITALAVIAAGAGIGVYGWQRKKSADDLPDASIEMWYCKSGDAERDKQEEAAYLSIIEDFRSSFSNVDIELRGFEPEEYEKKLKNADEPPAVYEYEGTRAGGEPLSLSSVYSSENGGKCSMLKNAEELSDGELLPLGYCIPVVFENTALSDHSGSVSSAEELAGEGRVVCDAENADKLLKGAEEYASDSALEDFLSGEAAFYIAYSDAYSAVAEALPGRYRILTTGGRNIVCSQKNVWAASDNGSDENRAALRLLEFMLSNNAQDSLHIRNSSGSVPINDEVRDVYTSVYDDFDGAFDSSGKYCFK